MRFSLITPVYNMQNFVESFMESVSNQTINDYEIIIVDYGSTDNTLSILHRYSGSIKNFHLIEMNMPYSKPSIARNFVLKKAQGDFFLFPDIDDWIEWNTLECLDAELTKNNAQTVVFQCVEESIGPSYQNSCNRIYPFPSGIYKAPFDSSLFISHDHVLAGGCWRKCYSSSVINEHNIRFDERLLIGDDILFDLDYFAHAQDFLVIKDILYHYRIHPSSLVRRYHENLLDLYLSQYRLANNIFQSWGIMDEYNTYIRQTKILKNALTCLKNAIHPASKKNMCDKQIEIKGIITHQEIRNALKAVSKNHGEGFILKNRILLPLMRLKFSGIILCLLYLQRFIANIIHK